MTTLTIPVHSHLWLSANDRIHWAPKAKRTRHLRIIGRLAAVDARIGRLGVSHVAAFIGYSRNGKADPANAAPTVKALIDLDLPIPDDILKKGERLSKFKAESIEIVLRGLCPECR